MDSEIKEAIISELKKLADKPWHRAEINFDFSPSSNRGYSGSQVFVDEHNEQIDIVMFGDMEFSNLLFRFIYSLNQKGQYNRIRTIAFRNNLDAADIQVSFEPSIVEKFESFLPKSKKGKTIPWWKNPDQIKSLGL